MLKSMKLVFLIIVFSSLFLGCSTNTDPVVSNESTSEPPRLIVSSGKDSFEALIGTVSWFSPEVSYEADAEIPPLSVLNQEDELKAQLNSQILLEFEVKPLEFEVHIWNEKERIASVPTDDYTFVADRKGTIVYEVKAKWNEGTAYYPFKINVD